MLLGNPEQGDTTPPIDGTTEDLNVDVIEESDRKKRGISEYKDKINGNLQNSLCLYNSITILAKQLK